MHYARLKRKWMDVPLAWIVGKRVTGYEIVQNMFCLIFVLNNISKMQH